MRPRESALFAATAIPAGIVALGTTSWLAWSSRQALSQQMALLLLTTLFALLSSLYSFAASGQNRSSLELAYFIAAATALPFPAALIVGAAAALTASLLRADPQIGGVRLASIAGANVTIATAMNGAACAAVSVIDPLLSARVSSPILRTLLLSGVLFLVMNFVNAALMSLWVASRGRQPHVYLRRFLTSIVPVETVTVPFGSLLAYAVRSADGLLVFAMIGAIGLFLSFLLKKVGDSQERLRSANQDLEERVSELATLNAIGREISSSLDSPRVFEIVRRECRKVFVPDFFWIARVDGEAREVRVEYSMAGDTPPKSMSFPLGQGLTTHVFDTEKPLLMRDASREIRMRNLRPIVLEPKIRSVLAVPMLMDNHVMGVLSVQSFREAVYDDHHVSLLTTIAQQTAVALENARHYQLATVDQLTGLYQRDYFFQRLGDEHRRCARYGSPFSVMMLDLDSFKRMNDRFGHFAGDRFLQSVGRTIKNILRAADAACRYGGEEFAVLLPETDLAGAGVIAERIRKEISELRVSDGPHVLGTTTSIGVSSFPVHFEGSLSGLLQKADQALYTAKRQGKDRVILAAA